MATGDHGLRPAPDRNRAREGVAAYVGDGANRWPGVHRRDAARLYRLALEQGVESGPYHAVADEASPFKAIAEVIGRRLGVPVISKTREEAAEHFGWIARSAGDGHAGLERADPIGAGWQPEQPGLIADLDQGGYFALSTCTSVLSAEPRACIGAKQSAGSAALQRRAGEVPAQVIS